MRRLLWFFQFLLVVAFTLPVAVVPRRISLKIGEVLGLILFHTWSERRMIAVRNLSDAVARGAITLYSSPEEVIKENFRNLGRSFVEVLKIYYGLGSAIVNNVEIRGAENFHRSSERGKGTLIITGHCGNWELNALALSVKVTKINVVARPVDNPFLNWVVERTRRKYGNSVIYKKGALRSILSALKKNEAVGILMDQSVVKSEGVQAEFLGKKDYTMKTPALIARKTGSAVISSFIRRVDGRHVIELSEPIELDGSEDTDQALFNDTVRFSREIEDYIRRNPAEWLWIHRRWKRVKE